MGRVGVLLVGVVGWVGVLLLLSFTSGRSTSLLPSGVLAWAGVRGLPLLVFPLKNRKVPLGLGLILGVVLGVDPVRPIDRLLVNITGTVGFLGVVGVLGLMVSILLGALRTLLIGVGPGALQSTVPSLVTLVLLRRLRGARGLWWWGGLGPPLGRGVGWGLGPGVVGVLGVAGRVIGLVLLSLFGLNVSLRLVLVLLLRFSMTLFAGGSLPRMVGVVVGLLPLPLWRKSPFSRSLAPLPLLLWCPTLLGIRVMSASKNAWNPLPRVLTLLRASLPCPLLPGTSAFFRLGYGGSVVALHLVVCRSRTLHRTTLVVIEIPKSLILAFRVVTLSCIILL